MICELLVLTGQMKAGTDFAGGLQAIETAYGFGGSAYNQLDTAFGKDFFEASLR